LDRILLRSTTLCPSNSKGFLSPIEIVQTEIAYFATAKAVDGKQENDGPGAEIKGALAGYGF
jgi:hypothetical protein